MTFQGKCQYGVLAVCDDLRVLVSFVLVIVDRISQTEAVVYIQNSLTQTNNILQNHTDLLFSDIGFDVTNYLRLDRSYVQ